MHTIPVKHRFPLVFCTLLLASSAWADSYSIEDLAWLKKIVLAAHQTDYMGTYIYQSGSYVETSRITHIREGENEHERLEGLDGERSEIIRKNDQVWCYLGDSKVMVAKRDATRTFPALLPAQLALLQENYVLQHGEDDRVAALPARIIVFQPRDKMRYSHKMWAHVDSGLLLKSVVIDEHHHVIEQYAFTQLKIGGDIDRKWIVQSRSAANQATTNTTTASAIAQKDSGWQVYALPAGFKKITEVSRRLKAGQLPVTHLVFSDGLAGISVFIEKIGEKTTPKSGFFSKGVIQVYSKVLDDNMLTVVGEVPPRTVMQVAESVRYGGQ